MVYAERTEDTYIGPFGYDAAQVCAAEDPGRHTQRSARAVAAEEHGDLICGIRNALFLSLLFWVPVIVLLAYW